MDAPVRLLMSEVYPNDHGRSVQQNIVSALAESLRDIGLKTPISVRKVLKVADGRDIDAYQIVAGHHRYEAALKLNWKEIDAFVVTDSDIDSQLWEIDENLIRAELTPAQEAEHMARRKVLWASKTSVATCNTSGRISRHKEFATATAESTGVNRSTVHRATSRGEKIAPDVLRDVQGTKLDTGASLDKLAKLPIREQRKAVSQVRLPDEPLNEFEAIQKQIAALMAAWNKAATEAREQFLARIERPVFDHTRSGTAG